MPVPIPARRSTPLLKSRDAGGLMSYGASNVDADRLGFFFFSFFSLPPSSPFSSRVIINRYTDAYQALRAAEAARPSRELIDSSPSFHHAARRSRLLFWQSRRRARSNRSAASFFFSSFPFPPPLSLFPAGVNKPYGPRERRQIRSPLDHDNIFLFFFFIHPFLFCSFLFYAN